MVHMGLRLFERRDEVLQALGGRARSGRFEEGGLQACPQLLAGLTTGFRLTSSNKKAIRNKCHAINLI